MQCNTIQYKTVTWKNSDSFETVRKIGNHPENPDSFKIIQENPDNFETLRKLEMEGYGGH